jgi:hypothetical protein
MIDSFFPAFFGPRNQEGPKVSIGFAILSQSYELYCTLYLFFLCLSPLFHLLFLLILHQVYAINGHGVIHGLDVLRQIVTI